MNKIPVGILKLSCSNDVSNSPGSTPLNYTAPEEHPNLLPLENSLSRVLCEFKIQLHPTPMRVLPLKNPGYIVP